MKKAYYHEPFWNEFSQPLNDLEMGATVADSVRLKFWDFFSALSLDSEGSMDPF